MENNSNEILVIDSLKIGYASKSLLSPLSASANSGEMVAILGRNGIGKSTLLRTIQGLQPSLGGNVLIDGKNISIFSGIQLARKIGYISTEIVKVSHMTIYDLVALGRFPYTNWIGRIDYDTHKIIHDSIEKTGLKGLEDRYISELSDGERQRAMIARILAQDTDILIMDEPTAFLDIASKYEIVNLMRGLTSEGKTIIFSTHDFNIAINQADKIWLIHGSDLTEGAPEDLILTDAFNHLFDSEIVGFNPEDGSFAFHNKYRGQIFIEGKGIKRHWTEKALERIGFLPAVTMTIPFVQVPAGKNDKWILCEKESSSAFGSLYDLTRKLVMVDKVLT
jgi:iron complex transport system ATP-binding protein